MGTLFEAFVYEWADSSNGKKYIGFHKGSIDDGYIGSGTHFKSAYKLRPECFTREIIATGTIDAMLELETFILEEINSISPLRNNPDYYNLQANIHNTHGKSPNKGKKIRGHSEETKKKMSESRKGRTFSAESRAKISAAHIGKTHSEETRAKLRALNLGKISPCKGMTRAEYRLIKTGVK